MVCSRRYTGGSGNFHGNILFVDDCRRFLRRWHCRSGHLLCAIAGCSGSIGFIHREILPFSSISGKLLKSGNGKIRKTVFTGRGPVIAVLFGMWNCFRQAGRKPDCSSFVKYGEQPCLSKIARHDFFNFLTG